jgi:ABC-type amino acid transport substrate-binding protein
MKRGRQLLLLLVLASAAAALVSLRYLERTQERSLELTAAESKWLAIHGKTIRYAPLPDSPPIDYVDSTDGRHRGLTSDYIRLVEERLGIRFVTVKCDSWAEIIEKLEAKEVDMVGSIQNTADRREFLLFTKPYQSISTVILVNQDNMANYNLNNMRGISIAVVDGSATFDYVKKAHDDYIFVPVQHAAKGLDFLAFRQVDAMIADIGVASYYIEERGITNLKIADDIGLQHPEKNPRDHRSQTAARHPEGVDCARQHRGGVKQARVWNRGHALPAHARGGGHRDVLEPDPQEAGTAPYT